MFLNAQWSLMGARGDLLDILVLPITTGTELGKCPALSVVLEDTGELWCPEWDGPKALPDVAAPVLSFHLLLHCWLISFRW